EAGTRGREAGGEHVGAEVGPRVVHAELHGEGHADRDGLRLSRGEGAQISADSTLERADVTGAVLRARDAALVAGGARGVRAAVQGRAVQWDGARLGGAAVV